MVGRSGKSYDMVRLVAGAILASFFIVVAVSMAYDINSLQRTLGSFEDMKRAQLELWKITTLFIGGILATLTALAFLRPPPEDP